LVELSSRLGGGDEPFWDENILNHSALISCMGGIFDDEIFKNDMRFEQSFMRSLAGRTLQAGDKTYKSQIALGVKSSELPHRKSMEFKIASSQKIKNIFYPNIVIYFAAEFYLFRLRNCDRKTIRSGPAGHHFPQRRETVIRLSINTTN